MPITQEKRKFRTNSKDQFYTNPSVAKRCIDSILSILQSPPTEYYWIEPSAGDGAVLNQIPEEYDKICIDIDPNSDNILAQDYLTWTPSSAIKKQ